MLVSIVDLETIRKVITTIPGDNQTGEDVCFESNIFDSVNVFDYLIFVDSRGERGADETNITWTRQLYQTLTSQGKTVLYIARPKVLTTFFTLINFLYATKLQFHYLITNMGFVDQTPKKNIFIEDMQQQVSWSKDLNLDVEIKYFSPYQLSSGQEEILGTLVYSSTFVEKIAKELQRFFVKVYFIETVVFPCSSNSWLARQRPDSFFEQLIVTNKLIHYIADLLPRSVVVSINNDNHYPLSQISSDAVHFTSLGHQLLYQNLSQYLINH